MSEQLNVLPLVIDVSKQPNDERLIEDFEWKLDDNILVLIEDKSGGRYWETFELVWDYFGEKAYFVKKINKETLTDWLRKRSSRIVRWIPLRFND